MKRLLLSLVALAGILGAAHAVNINGINSSGQNQIVSMGYGQVSVTNAITAFAGGGQASAVQLNSAFNRVTVVGTAADSVKLPLCVTQPAGLNGSTVGVGTQVWVMNTSANSLNVFPSTGDAINALSANTAIAVATVTGKLFTCAVAGTWQSLNHATF